MAQSPKQLANLKKWPKGKSGNPEGGRVSNNPELTKIKKLTRDELAEIGAAVTKMSIVEMQNYIREAFKEKAPHPAIKVWYVAIALKSMQKGDASAFDTTMNRIVGKNKDEIEIKNLNPTVVAVVDKKALAQAIKELRDDV